jgi:hypothetical protein
VLLVLLALLLLLLLLLLLSEGGHLTLWVSVVRQR